MQGLSRRNRSTEKRRIRDEPDATCAATHHRHWMVSLLPNLLLTCLQFTTTMITVDLSSVRSRHYC